MAGRVRRYHTTPTEVIQTNADHSWGVAVLLVQLHPDPSKELLIEALLHDTGEYIVGDIPATAKWTSPELKEVAHIAEMKARWQLETTLEQVFPEGKLTIADLEWLKACDMLDLLMHSRLHKHELEMEKIYYRVKDWFLENSGKIPQQVKRFIDGNNLFGQEPIPLPVKPGRTEHPAPFGYTGEDE